MVMESKRELKDELAHILEVSLSDELKARFLTADKIYTRPAIKSGTVNSQEVFQKRYGGKNDRTRT